jgi:hypothetical protein
MNPWNIIWLALLVVVAVAELGNMRGMAVGTRQGR